ncbi:MAG TPA: hypothetical protein VK208_04835 [Pyrinomonadaceae bacterium]|jgi:hypothetical protein|nr:hypothetical protein [Pyrinomonadaceae bacterium]
MTTGAFQTLTRAVLGMRETDAEGSRTSGGAGKGFLIMTDATRSNLFPAGGFA